MRPILEMTLDKAGWSTYIENPEAKFSVLVDCRQAFESLLIDKNPQDWDDNEEAFVEAYSDFVVSNLVEEG